MALGEDSPGDYQEKLPADDTYVVQRGDTLAGVALRLGVKQSELKRANHMYGSRTLVAGQVLRTSGPPKPTDGEEVATAPPANAHRTQCHGVDYGDARLAPARAAGTSTTPGAEAVVVAEDGVVVEPPLEEEIEDEEIWFEQSRREQAGPGAGARMGSSRSIGSAGSSSSLMPPIGETNSPLPPVLSPASGLLYEPPQWGGMADFGGGVGGGSRSRQASDASSTASAAAATAGASVRDMFKYVRSKAAALATTATAATYYSSDDNANAASGGNKPATISTTGASTQRRTVARADSISSLNYSGGGDGGDGNNGGSSTASGIGGSLPTTPGVPNVDEALPPAELWGGEREDAAKATACAAAQAAAREVSEAAQRAARDASDASNQSTAQTLLSMVRPSYWRSTSSEGAGAGSQPAAVGGWGGGGGESGRSVGGEEDNDRRSVGFAGAGSSVERNSDCPVDESLMGSFYPAFANAGGVSPRAGEAEAAPPPPPAPLKLPGLVCGGSTIVTHSTLARMDAAQPKHHRGYNWYLLFSTLRDGASYTTLYNRIKAEDPTFLIVENMKGEVFGGFATSAWASGSQYYGTGECFLFKIDGERVTVPKDDPDGDDDDSEDGTSTKTLVEGEISTYGWTGMNMYLQYSDAEGMGMGGGGAEGSFGLFIGEDFLSGSTGRCDTYGNPPLCSEQQFQVSQVEVWGFTTADTEMGARLERLRKTLRGKTTRPL